MYKNYLECFVFIICKLGNYLWWKNSRWNIAIIISLHMGEIYKFMNHQVTYLNSQFVEGQAQV